MPEVPARNEVSACSGARDVGIELAAAPKLACAPVSRSAPSLRSAPPIGDDEVASRLAAASSVLSEVRSALAQRPGGVRALREALDQVDGRPARLWVRAQEGASLDVDASLARVLAVDLPMRRAALGELVTAVCERALETAGDELDPSELDALLARVAGWTRLAGG